MKEASVCPIHDWWDGGSLNRGTVVFSLRYNFFPRQAMSAYKVERREESIYVEHGTLLI
jgi:hypothetical protein